MNGWGETSSLHTVKTGDGRLERCKMLKGQIWRMFAKSNYVNVFLISKEIL